MAERYTPVGSTIAGGIGSVVVCKDNNLDRKVAIKFVQGINDHRRLLDELAALLRIRSKHVVEVFDVAYFDPGSRMGIVEEFLEGDDLSGLLGTITSPDAFTRLIYQMSRGIADIHAVSIVHRDIKPDNMKIGPDGILKIFDFNLARSNTDGKTTGFVGTRGFAAPEQYGVGDVTFTSKIDVYAMAVSAWALWNGATLPKELRAVPPRPDDWKAATGGFSINLDGDKKLLALLDACVSDAPILRPTAKEVCERASRVISQGRHRAVITDESGKVCEVNSAQPRVKIEHGALGRLVVAYDGFEFTAVDVSGEVWVNNMTLTRGQGLPDCCVIALGPPSLKATERVFVTIDVSHPEVVL